MARLPRTNSIRRRRLRREGGAAVDITGTLAGTVAPTASMVGVETFTGTMAGTVVPTASMEGTYTAGVYAAGPARYWRVLVIDVNGSPACSCTKLELRETPSGADVATGGTPSASTTNNGFVAANAFDGNSGTFWVSTVTAPLFWLAYDLGSGNDKEITEIVWQARSDGLGTGEQPNTFAVQQSSDGTTWLTTWLVTGSSAWGVSEVRTFTKGTPDTAAHTSWRLRAVSVQTGGTNVALSELEFRATVGGADQTSGGTAIKSSQFDGTTHAAINAFDNNTSTKWATSGGPPGWIGYTFGSAVSVLQIAVTSRDDASFNQAPKVFAVEWSDDAVSWSPAWIAEFAAFTQAETKLSARA